MKRKIIRQGHNTLTVTLPAEWTKKFNLEAGKEIDLIEKDNGLFISTEKNGKTKRIEFDITGMDIPTIWKYFMGVYREGYDEVLVKFNPDSPLESPYKFLTIHKYDPKYGKEGKKIKIVEALHGFVDRFIGFEIVEHGKDYILIKEMGELTSKEFDNSLRRVFLLVQQMSEETVDAINNSDAENLTHMHEIDINLDKFHDYCIRILNKISHKESRKTSLLFAHLYLLELLGDEFKNIAHHLIQDFPKSDFKKIREVSKLVKEQIDLYYDLFYKFEKDKLKRISEIDSKLYTGFSGFYKKATDAEKEIFHHLRIISRYLNALVELRIEMEF